MFPITPVFNSSLQYSHNQSISPISKPQDQCTIILSPFLTTFSCHIRSCTPYHTPSKHLNSNESPTKIVDDIQPHDLFDQSQISTRVSDHTDHRPRPGLTCRHLIYRYVCKQAYTSRNHYVRVSEGSTYRERCKSSNSELNKNEQISIACGGEFKSLR